MNTLTNKDRKSVIHPFTQLRDYESGKANSILVSSGKGIYIYDENQREIIDGFSGLYCVNVGHGRKEIINAMAEQGAKLPYYHCYAGFTNESLISLTEKIQSFMPFPDSHIFYGMSGSDANETQIKLVWYYNNVKGRTKAKKIISRMRGYHGCSILSGSLTGMSFYHNHFDIPVSGVLHTTNPHYYWEAETGMTEAEFSEKCANDLENMIQKEGADTIGAFIAEPVLGTGGIIPPPKNYWDEIQKVLERHEIPLISDEVICGFGRIGARTGSEKYGMRPDFITAAKGLTSGYAPLSASIISGKVWDVLLEGADKFGPFSHGYTYSGHPICTAAGIANLEILQKENIIDRVCVVGKYFQKRLRETFENKPYVGEVRGVGMLGALEFVESPKKRFDPNKKVGSDISTECFANGLIARAMPHGDILGFAPPLISTKEEIDKILDIAARAVKKITNSL